MHQSYIKYKSPSLEARSVCLDQAGDLLTMRDLAEKTAIVHQLSKIRKSYISGFWISLNERDYQNYFYWSDNEANSFTSWGSGSPHYYPYNDKASKLKYFKLTLMNTDIQSMFSVKIYFYSKN